MPWWMYSISVVVWFGCGMVAQHVMAGYKCLEKLEAQEKKIQNLWKPKDSN